MKTTIAYLGPKATYTERAALNFAKRLGGEAELTPCTSFGDVFELVENGTVEYGVVATENSIEGPVTATLDSFANSTNITILGEEVLDIDHCLVAHPDASEDDIRLIASHGQALAQCRQYLQDHFGQTKKSATFSTADAVRMAMADKTVAAIANADAADLYGAKILHKGIQDYEDDQTSFALIAAADHPQPFTGAKYRTSLALFQIDNKAGGLMMILSEFAFANINLTKIQSRPTKRALGQYMFFVDAEGSINDPNVKTALACLKLKIRDVRILGSYPIQ